MNLLRNELVFPMSLDYLQNSWNEWDVVRELVSNARDADPDGYRHEMIEDDLVITSTGSHLEEHHLLLGVTQKGSSDSIGQFGEGMKVALLVLTRMGLTAHIYSGPRHFWNESATVYGVDTFKIVWEEDGSYFEGTQVVIPNWPYPAYTENFLRPGDPRIVHSDWYGRSILLQAEPDFFVKGVWVGRAMGGGMGYAFGYNLVDVKMNRDRKMVDSWNANWEIGRIWASVEDEDLLARFFYAIKNDSSERDANLAHTTFTNMDAARRAFYTAFGDTTVVQTDDRMALEAKHRGANPFKFSWYVQEGLAHLIGTDVQFVQDFEGAEAIFMPDERLNRSNKSMLKKLRQAAALIDPDIKVFVYIMPGKDGDANGQKKVIRLSPDVLESPIRAFSTLIHEIAHIRMGTYDLTENHFRAIEEIGAQIIAVLLKLGEK